MEDHLFELLHLPKDQDLTVLDAGCGVGHVAIHMAEKGLNVEAIDVVPHHVEKAQKHVRAANLSHKIQVQHMDYHHLSFPNECFDGVYTMETLVHATSPDEVLRKFFETLKPGGHLAMHEYDHIPLSEAPPDLRKSMDLVNKYSAMPTNSRFEIGVLEEMLRKAGFVDVELKDISQHIWPMLKLFYLVGVLPLIIIRFFGLEKYFVNTVAGVESWRGRKLWRYVAVSARKPEKS
ncbi:S-adenosyl-L-methionine-dependent methyltransferase [Aulographum hederae CBS 113979]|uniref:S-adenosyl-L-methionine-dependent methyltransferase n=1 Tax=Aulographum hederae CBS 113979 TaxID=1176131 RepID=A0A6G1GK28_9PEZI|nr:S-adenosyl-L-methionine-dependent methyltransferase [Aulographum hederae CBS 113979]